MITAAELDIRFGADTSDVSSAFRKVDGQMSGLGHRILSGTGRALGMGMVAAGAGLLALGGLAARGAAEAQQVGLQTEAVLESTGGAANVTAAHVDDLALSIMNLSGMDDEAVRSAENLLLTFTAVRNEAGKGNDIFDQATKAIADVSVAFDKDLNASAIMVGKALQDPVAGLTALGRVGVQFSEQQKKMIARMVESGDVMSAQKVILAELAKQTEGSAKAMGESFTGQLNIAKETVGNTLEDIGASLLTNILPVLGPLTKTIGKALEGMAPVLGKVFGAIAKVLAALLPAIQPVIKVLGEVLAGVFETLAPVIKDLAPIIAELAMNFGQVLMALMPLLPPLGDLLVALAPLLPLLAELLVEILKPLIPVLAAVIEVIAGVVKAIVDWVKKSEILQTVAKIVGQIAAEVIKLIMGLARFLMGAWKTIASATVSIWSALKATAKTVWEAIKTVIIHPVQAVWDGIKRAWNAAKDFLRGAWNSIKDTAATIWNGISAAIRAAINIAIDAINILISGLNRLHDAMAFANPVGGAGWDRISPIPPVATGGDVRARGLALVGEQGPEVLELPAGARITPLSPVATNPMGGGVINIYTYTLDWESFAAKVSLARREAFRKAAKR